jgi:hypothetical protein
MKNDATIRIRRDLYEWAAGFAGKNPFFRTVEETVQTALRCMRASEGGMTLWVLAELVAREKRLEPEEALFGEKVKDGRRKAVRLLLRSLHLMTKDLASEGDLPDDPGELEAMETVMAALGLPMVELLIPESEPTQEELNDIIAQLKKTGADS